MDPLIGVDSLVDFYLDLINYPVSAKRFLQMRGLPLQLTCRNGQEFDVRNELLLGSFLETFKIVGNSLNVSTVIL